MKVFYTDTPQNDPKGHVWRSAGMGGCYSACERCGFTCDEGCGTKCEHPVCDGIMRSGMEWYKLSKDNKGSSMTPETTCGAEEADLSKCQHCQIRPAESEHTCPYAEEIHGVDSPCNCCDECVKGCIDDI